MSNELTALMRYAYADVHGGGTGRSFSNVFVIYIYIEQIDNGLNCFRSLRSNIIAT